MINSFPVSVSIDHDSEGKRVQDMLSTIEKPQVGMHISSHCCAHTHARAAHITHLLSDAVIAGMRVNIFSKSSSRLRNEHEMYRQLCYIYVCNYFQDPSDGPWRQ